jgi:hypothetical protein
VSRIAVWGVSIVLGSASACTFDFDAPFAGSGGGGPGSSGSTEATTTAGSTTTSAGGGDGGAGAGGDPTGATTSASTASAGGSVAVPCGGDDCAFDVEEGGCCWSPPDAAAECFTSPPSNSDCRTSAQPASREALIRCRDASDCGGGEECCATYVLDGQSRVYSVVACAAACGASATLLCDPNAEDPCPLTEAACEPAPGLPPDYHGCFF